MCPDQGSPSRSARFIIRMCNSPPRTCSIIATAERFLNRRNRDFPGVWSLRRVSMSCNNDTDT